MINPNAFVFAQFNPTVSLAKYFAMNKDKLQSSGKQKLMDIDLFFRNWSLSFQYTKQFTQLGCTADLITSIRTEQLTPSGLKNLVCDIAPVTVSIKNYVVTEVTANMAGYKATDACLAKVRDFFSTRAFVVPSQRVEISPCAYVFKTQDWNFQSELVNQEYGRVMSISVSTAGGVGEKQDEQINYGLKHIFWLLRELHEGRNNYYQPSFQPLPLLARNTEEQIEEEGANEEIDAQIKNKGYNDNIMDQANYVKAAILNHFIKSG
ncbi:MAG: hypothetical protein EZS28_032146 [Streblomastix strix]|uniref:Uncharacterized protein n=1 Tax=Streblomastix strix TaxID=222440 RepID=A0A5J4UPD6_9EUKA|nr:MAG: hypothetical protein EZS28_032146 [Streblomastix strix]